MAMASALHSGERSGNLGRVAICASIAIFPRPRRSFSKVVEGAALLDRRVPARSDGHYSLWSRRHFCRVEDQSVPSDPGESCSAPLRLRIRGPITSKGTPEGVLWQTCWIFSGLNAKKVVYTTS